MELVLNTSSSGRAELQEYAVQPNLTFRYFVSPMVRFRAVYPRFAAVPLDCLLFWCRLYLLFAGTADKLPTSGFV